jgi:hypothetical protein
MNSRHHTPITAQKQKKSLIQKKMNKSPHPLFTLILNTLPTPNIKRHILFLLLQRPRTNSKRNQSASVPNNNFVLEPRPPKTIPDGIQPRERSCALLHRVRIRLGGSTAKKNITC